MKAGETVAKTVATRVSPPKSAKTNGSHGPARVAPAAAARVPVAAGSMRGARDGGDRGSAGPGPAARPQHDGAGPAGARHDEAGRMGPAVASTHFIRSRIGKICVAITGATPAEMMQNAEAIIREDHFVEFRLDYLPNPVAVIPKIKQLLYERSEVTAIATCRRAQTGGKFKGTIAAELDVLEKAAIAGCHLIDVELQTAEHMKPAQMKQLRSHGAALIVSWHDFEETKDLDKVFDRIQQYQPEFVKIVSTAKTLTDNVTMMRFLERRRDEANLIGISMGEQGTISRVLGLRAGSVFTFAAAHAGEETGAGAD